MKKKLLQLTMSASVAIMLSACTHYYYAPNSSNIPLFKKKNTMKINGGYSNGDNYNGGEVQLAYSVSSKIGVMFNSFFAGNTETVESNGNSHLETGKGSLFEIGAGYYKPFGTQNKWTFETYAGAGIGTEKHTYENSQKATLNLIRYFVQPSIGYSSLNGFLEVALGSRFCDLKLKVKEHNVTATNGGGNDTDKKDLDNINLSPSSVLWEPAIRLGLGWEDFKFYLQLTSSQNLSNLTLPQDHTNFNIGIKISIK